MFNLSSIELSHFLISMAILLALAHLLGYLAERLAIPRVIGEVSAGLVLGPTLLGYFYPGAFTWLFSGFPEQERMFGLMYQIGLILLMFCSGLKFHTKFKMGDGKIVSVLVLASTILPFALGWLVTYLIDLKQFLGPANNDFALKIVIAIAIAVTSIPVISKIFIDLGIMHSRFAKLIVAIAGIHDILLWVALGIATSVAGHSGPVTAGSVFSSIGITIVFFIMTIISLRFLFNKLTIRNGNFLFRASHIGYFLFIVFVISALAGYLNVETMFGALLVGIGAKLTIPNTLFKRLEQSIFHISFSWFIPLYFAVVGLKLDLAKHFEPLFFLQFLLFATLAQTIIVFFACKLIRQDALTSFNFAMAMNARGGPGIVLSTVAFSAGIINQEFFGVLVMLALVTSWFAGSWLRFVLNRGWRIMPGDEDLVPDKINNHNDIIDLKRQIQIDKAKETNA
ncbi:cation:proton antiporter [Bacillus benzoevorans]|uniref:Kef-type K+ transport system membrane component KefB n=1 Tax=Bacillus benzoevorans TaxID=1456 RepID=A0A7X0HRF9_9BACI|nr:cation:proton antiporter [Bacillus benzoevorans]MBB6445449.1 Kef-type K+ transport system membrane component KefB [Bacillus benzoevorans]